MKIDITQYTCDICGKHTILNPEMLHWFVLPNIKENGYACIECGHYLHNVFDLLGVNHKFVCQQYNLKSETGLLEVLK